MPPAVAEYKAAVEMASQNPSLAHFLTPVLKRLLEVQVALARSHWLASRADSGLAACTDALATTEKLKDSEPVADCAADLKVQQARCLLALGRKAEGEELMRRTLAAQPGTEYWQDGLLTVRGT